MTGRYRVKVAAPHTIREYVVEAKDRDAAWRAVHLHRDDLAPVDEYEAGGVFWAAAERDEDAG